MLSLDTPPRITCFLVKIASRCNLDCDYCYVYRHADQSWRGQPAIMSEEHRRKLACRIGEYSQAIGLERLLVVFHGGEPLLAGPERIAETARWIRAAVPHTTKVDFSIQTNGVLLDDAALSHVASADIAVSLSMDGPQIAHDLHRLDHKGKSSFEKVEAALLRLTRRPDVFAGLIAVIDPAIPPEDLFEFFVAHDPPNLDFLLPDANYLRPPLGREKLPNLYKEWLIRAFDLWFDRYASLSVRLFDSLLNSLAGLPNETDAFGMGDVSLLTIDTDGTYHDLDVLKIVGEGASALGLSLDNSTVVEAARSPGIARHRALLRWEGLAPECQRCPVVQQCGGGSVPHRAAMDGFRHPTIYCQEMLSLVSHARSRLSNRIEEERKAFQPLAAEGIRGAIDLDAYERPETSETILRQLLQKQVVSARRKFEIALDYSGDRDSSQREAIQRLRAIASAKIDSLVIRPSVVAWANAICQVARGNSVSDIGGNPIPPDFGYIAFLADWASNDEGETRPLLHRTDRWLRLPFGTKIIFEDHEVARAGASIVQEALAVIEVWKRSLIAEIRILSSELQFIRDPEAHPAKIVSFSDNSIPGALYVSVRQAQGYVDPYDLADSIVHEHRHQKLYLLQNTDCLVTVDKPLVPSPWRSDLRPPSGLFHAVFVFSHLLDFWAHCEMNGPSKLRDRGRQNVETTRKNLAKALPILKATPLTEIGSRLVSVLENRVASVGCQEVAPC